jgi:PAS domain S-box-containing protein
MDENLFRDFFENAPGGLALLAMDGRLLHANPRFLQIACLNEPIPPDWRFHQTLSPAGGIFYEMHFFPALLLRGELKEVAFDLARPAGEALPVLVNANLQKNEEGAPIAIRLALFEARERRRYERELLQSRRNSEQSAEVVRRSSDAIITASPEGLIQGWNNGAEQMFAHTHQEVIGQSLSSLLFGEPFRKEFQQIVQRLQKGEDVRIDLTGIHRDAHEIELSAAFTPHIEPPGDLVAFSAIIRDISSRKRAERALLQSEKLASVGRLAASIAHEINNPLESVTNLLYILSGSVSTSDTKHLVGVAQEELARVSQIVTQTLRFHKQSTGRTQLEVADLLNSVLNLYRARLRNSGIEAEIQRSDASPLFCYEGEVRQVLLNLVGNALDAMRAAGGGKLVLRARNTAFGPNGLPGVRITIADSGTGMNDETLRHVFEPFFTTKGLAGTGLGLWITKELVERNGGKIKVRSCTTGKSGTTFALLFPHLPGDR